VGEIINSTQAAILDCLIDSPDFISAKSISEKIGCSDSVVRFHIRPIIEWLKVKKCSINSVPRNGYCVDASAEMRKRLKNELQQEIIKVKYFPSDRQNLLIFKLLFLHQSQTIDNLAKTLSVSKSTLIRDLKKVEHWLAKHKVFINKQPGIGTTVVGEEVDIRQTLSSLIPPNNTRHCSIKIMFMGIARKEKQEYISSVNPYRYS
jgi:transcriptional antiterminator